MLRAGQEGLREAKRTEKSFCQTPGGGVRGPEPAGRALGSQTLTSVECQHLLQSPAFSAAHVDLTEKASRFPVDPKASQL